MELQGVAKELFWKIARKEIGDMAKWRHSKSKFLAGSQTFTLFCVVDLEQNDTNLLIKGEVHNYIGCITFTVGINPRRP